MLLRLRDFSNTNRDLFASSTAAQAAFASLSTAIDELTATDLRKVSASVSARADQKGVSRKTLIDVLTKASALARVMKAQGQPIPVFAMPASKSDQSLLTSGRQFARDAAAFDAEFSDHGVGPATIAEATASFEAAARDRGVNRADHTAAQSRIRDLLVAAMLDVRRLDLIVDKHLAGDENGPLRNVWKQMRRIESARGRRAVETEGDEAVSPPPEAPAEAAASPEVAETPASATVIDT
jgi:hypothetical protein